VDCCGASVFLTFGETCYFPYVCSTRIFEVSKFIILACCRLRCVWWSRKLHCCRLTAILKWWIFFRALRLLRISSSRFRMAASRDRYVWWSSEGLYVDFIVYVTVLIAASVTSIDVMNGFPGIPCYNSCVWYDCEQIHLTWYVLVQFQFVAKMTGLWSEFNAPTDLLCMGNAVVLMLARSKTYSAWL
jgi:hypothetical protein